ncbi:hypothetical protein [Actinoplanes sp. CA-252034]|uniref:hypothetical protein n=1 Tax=Actinoplanes sp. CA-252034 TaxID=3239906 RepID=UPI003D9677D3
MKKIVPWVGAGAVLAAGVLTFANAGVAAEAVDAPSSLVEDYSHPGAEAILSEFGLKVLKGDGNIQFSSRKSFEDEVYCPVAEIQVEKSVAVEPYGYYYCFKTSGTKGVLTLEVPGTFGVRAGNSAVKATAQTDEGTEVFDIPANTPKAIDPGDGNGLPTAVLVELRIG